MPDPARPAAPALKHWPDVLTFRSEMFIGDSVFGVSAMSGGDDGHGAERPIRQSGQPTPEPGFRAAWLRRLVALVPRPS